MVFPKDYFEDEVRDGFYVPSMIKRAWAAQVEVLKEVTEICDRHGIKFFAEWGTMLGAVRHGGFIPWDDDLDIVMLRKDYEAFLKVARRELPERYQINNIHSMPDFDNLLTRLNTTEHYCVEADYLEHYQGCPCSVGLDIFVLDYIPRDPEIQRQLKRSVKLMSSMKYQIEGVDESEREDYIRPVEESLGVKIDRDKPLMGQFAEICEMVCSLYHEEEADEVTIITLWEQNDGMRYPKEWFEKTIRIPFENYEIPVPVGYEELLRKKYGNYMKPVRDYDSHDYPYFKEQYDELFDHQLRRRRYTPEPIEYPRQQDTRKELFESQCVELMELMGQVEGLLKEASDAGNQKSIRELSDVAADLSRQANDLLAEEEKRKRQVVFLPVQAKWWKAMDALWEEEIESEDTEVTVIPLPYYRKDGFERIIEECYDGDLFPENVKITHYNALDMEQLHPDKIYIQVPYDGYNEAITVHEYFYTPHLRQMTDCLVYVPYFVTDEIREIDMRASMMMQYYCTMPGVLLSDITILQSEEMKQAYIRSLVKFCGEETRDIWEAKLQPLGSSLYLHPYGEEYLDARPEKATDKKILCFHMGVAKLLRSFERLQEVLDTFREYQDKVFILWWEEAGQEKNLKELDPELCQKYVALRDGFVREGFCILDDTQDRERFLAWCDAYYGDSSYVADLFSRQKKPVMLMM